MVRYALPCLGGLSACISDVALINGGAPARLLQAATKANTAS